MCACARAYMPALHTTEIKKKKKGEGGKVLSTYGAQANSSEEMLTSRRVASYLLSVLFREKKKIANVQRACIRKG